MFTVEHDSQTFDGESGRPIARHPPVSVYRRCQSGELESFKLGSTPDAGVRIPRDAVVRYIAQNYRVRRPPRDDD
jgi:hypothetical protein